MKRRKILPILLLALVLVFFLLPEQDSGRPETLSLLPAQTAGDVPETDAGTDAELSVVQDAPDSSGQPEDLPDEHGTYTSKEDVALYIHTYGHLPDNFITKEEAEHAGWSGGSLEKYLPGMCIGGNRFQNREGILPDAPGRVWTECDINTLGAKSRGRERIVFSNDGLIYYTDDHYESFTLLYD